MIFRTNLKWLCLHIFLLSLPSFCDTTTVQNNYKNIFELNYLIYDGFGIAYLPSISKHFNLDFHFDYNNYDWHNQNRYIIGTGIQHSLRQFGKWDLSLLYSLRQSFLFYRDSYNKSIEYGTGIGIIPKIQMHFSKRFYAYFSLSYFFEIIYFKEYHMEIPPTLFVGRGNYIDFILGTAYIF
jgi:hypothetical protein